MPRWARLAIFAGIGIVAVVAFATRSSLRVEVSAEVAESGGSPEVVLRMAVCSNGVLPSKSIEVARPSWEVRDGTSGRVVADDTHALFTLELEHRVWGARECRRVLRTVWDAHTWNQEDGVEPEVGGTPARGGRVPPGTYRFIGRWGDLDQAGTRFDVPPR